jgi:hypothetical protein
MGAMGEFLTKVINYFSIAFGVVIGASILGGMAAVLTLQPPTFTMKSIAENMKIWAIVAAIGGTIDPFRVIETNFLHSQYSPVIEQILYIVSAFIGAYMGTKLILWVCGGDIGG